MPIMRSAILYGVDPKAGVDQPDTLVKVAVVGATLMNLTAIEADTYGVSAINNSVTIVMAYTPRLRELMPNVTAFEWRERVYDIRALNERRGGKVALTGEAKA